MKEKLQVVATQLLEPEMENGPSSLLIVLGMPPREATVAYIANSRTQVAEVFQAIGTQVEESQMQSLMTAVQSIESFPEESEEPGVVLEDESAQAALEAIDPIDDRSPKNEEEMHEEESEGLILN